MVLKTYFATEVNNLTHFLKGRSIRPRENGGWYVAGNLDLSNTSVRVIPDNLQVEGNFDLSNTPVRKIPGTLKVGGNFDLSNTKVRVIPDTVEVGGSLHLRATQVKKIPDGHKVRGYIYMCDGSIYSDDKEPKISNAESLARQFFAAPK